jgi:segregation and condensation protein B
VIELSEIKRIIEALIFAADAPVPESRIRHVIEEIEPADIQRVVDELNAEYEQNRHAFKIVQIAGGFQLVTRPEFSNYVKLYYKGRTKSRLSRAALEALAIIAFKQPISRPEIDAIRGVNSDGVVKNLLERNLIHISGRSSAIGRALLYSTTPEFLRYFGINDIADLPKPREIEELLGSTQAELPFASEEVDGSIVEKISALDEPEPENDAIE